MLTKIVLTDPVSPTLRALFEEDLRHDFEFQYCPDEESRALHVPDADVLLLNRLSPHTLALAANCRLIQKLSVGLNAVDVDGATARGIPISTVPGANSLSVAEHAVLLMLGVYRHLARLHQQLVEGHYLKTELRAISHELSGKTVGLVGLGSIARHVATLLTGFGCQIVYFDTYRPSVDTERALNVNYAELDELFAISDVISLHVPFTPQTANLVDARRLALAKSTAIVVNTCRGEIVDESALAAALRDGQILGAGLDVLNDEPPAPDNPLLGLPTVVLTPHVGAGTVESMERIAALAVETIRTLSATGTFAKPENVLNLTRIVAGNGGSK